ncbi:alpha/beta fold hydrolase [Asanoa sp. WMMD1127]|uniref:alpha/beta fold hydrolase n=1 Tax=Asanoa sp. WMMD1127 TaxID=3016107 RepID=UPI00241695E3|nr:alpha/beta fold hydrolase [Asanoa sp. WMMD1127]MDG4825481.1 alpha/beta fold hydrolase [Asanoa sp. WMMD1127]
MDTYVHEGLTFPVSDHRPRGESRSVVVLLHGFPQDRRSWDAVAGALTAAGHRVLAPDQRGYSPGAAPRRRAAYTLPKLAGDVLALADAAGADRFHLVGHDWGASVAWHLAARHPERLRSLACLSVPHPAALGRALLTSGQAIRSAYIAAFVLPVLPERYFAGRRGREWPRRAGLDSPHAERYAARLADPDAVRGPLAWYRAIGLNPSTGPVDVPTLFMWGDGDRYVTRAAARRCGRYVRAPYEFHVLKGASHWLPEQAPGQVSGLLLPWLRLREAS